MSKKRRTTRRTTTPKDASPPPISGQVFVAGIVLLAGALGAALMLSLDYLPMFTPPGCGEDGGCAKLKGSAFGTLPGTNWPTPFFGFAYFAALLIAWVRFARPTPPWMLRHVTLLGAIGSVGYLLVMFDEGAFCMYCVMTHVCNFGFLGLLELGTRKRRTGAKGVLVTGAVSFAASSIAVGGVLLAGEMKATSETDEFINQLAGGGETNGETDTDVASARTTDGATQPATTNDPPFTVPAEPVALLDFDLPADETHGPGRPGFTGRYLIGTADAPIRIVTFAGFQCGSCQAVEKELWRIVRAHGDSNVSLSMKQFPYDADCNEFIRTTVHAFGCESAKAAEAAGILGGPDAFWEMAAWLFGNLPERTGQLGDAKLSAHVIEMGLDWPQFKATMESDVVAEAITADIREGRALGLTQTPMVFINGQVFRNWNYPGQLTRAVDGLIARNLPRRDATADVPLDFATKLIDDWKEQPPLRNLAVPQGPFRGATSSEARTTVVAWGCYQSRVSRDMDRLIREGMERTPGVRYQFRLFPLHESCNPMSDTELSPRGCEMARAALVAREMGGDDAFWRMHDWLFSTVGDYAPGDLAATFARLGIDADAAIARMESPEIQNQLMADAFGLQRLRDERDPRKKVRGAPAVFIGDRWAETWRRDDRNLLPEMIDIAAGGG